MYSQKVVSKRVEILVSKFLEQKGNSHSVAGILLSPDASVAVV